MSTKYKMSGIVGWDITANMFRDGFPSEKEIDLMIDSEGGSCIDGIAIAEFIRYKRKAEGYKVNAKILGICGSISTIIALACDHVAISPMSQFFVHRSQVGVYGNTEDFDKAKEELELFDAKMVSTYVAKTGKSEEEIKKIMEEEKLISAERAKEIGFVDEVMDFSGNAVAKKIRYSAVAKYEKKGESEAHVYITINQAEESPGATQIGETESGETEEGEENIETPAVVVTPAEEEEESAEDKLAAVLAELEDTKKKHMEAMTELESMKNMMSEAKAKAEVRAVEARAKLTTMPEIKIEERKPVATASRPRNSAFVPRPF